MELEAFEPLHPLFFIKPLFIPRFCNGALRLRQSRTQLLRLLPLLALLARSVLIASRRLHQAPSSSGFKVWFATQICSARASSLFLCFRGHPVLFCSTLGVSAWSVVLAIGDDVEEEEASQGGRLEEATSVTPSSVRACLDGHFLAWMNSESDGDFTEAANRELVETDDIENDMFSSDDGTSSSDEMSALRDRITRRIQRDMENSLN